MAPLYDLLSTACYPELSKQMAMKIGREYHSGKILPKHFDQMAEEAGLAKPMVKRRLLEVAEALLSKTPALATQLPAAQPVAALVHSRCATVIQNFRPV